LVITLEQAKLYLRVDGDAEDALITNFIASAEELCEGILRCPIAEFTVIPEAVKQAILYAVGNLYEQREEVELKAVLDVMTRLLFACRQAGW